MGRLIDADKFISWLDCGHLRHPSEKCLSELNVKQMIDNQPTAYAVEKVINQLENKMFSAECYNNDFNGCEISNLLCMGDVYEIVKAGGIDE